MIDEIKAKLDSLAAANDEIEKLRAYASDSRAAIMATIQPELDELMASVKVEIDAMESCYNSQVTEWLQVAERLESEVRVAVIAEGKSVKATHLHAVYSKGRVTWDGKKLDGMMSLIPQLVDARKEGDPSVTIRKV